MKFRVFSDAIFKNKLPDFFTENQSSLLFATLFTMSSLAFQNPFTMDSRKHHPRVMANAFETYMAWCVSELERIRGQWCDWAAEDAPYCHKLRYAHDQAEQMMISYIQEAQRLETQDASIKDFAEAEARVAIETQAAAEAQAAADAEVLESLVKSHVIKSTMDPCVQDALVKLRERTQATTWFQHPVTPRKEAPQQVPSAPSRVASRSRVIDPALMFPATPSRTVRSLGAPPAPGRVASQSRINDPALMFPATPSRTVRSLEAPPAPGRVVSRSRVTVPRQKSTIDPSLQAALAQLRLERAHMTQSAFVDDIPKTPCKKSRSLEAPPAPLRVTSRFDVAPTQRQVLPLRLQRAMEALRAQTQTSQTAPHTCEHVEARKLVPRSVLWRRLAMVSESKFSPLR